MLRALYLLLAAVGAALPLSQLVPFFLERGPDVGALVAGAFANRAAASFALDALITGVVALVFVAAEGRKRQMRWLWAYPVAMLLVGVSFALPLFLYAREGQVRRRTTY